MLTSKGKFCIPWCSHCLERENGGAVYEGMFWGVSSRPQALSPSLPSFSPLDCTKIEIEFQRQDNDPASKHLKTPGLAPETLLLSCIRSASRHRPEVSNSARLICWLAKTIYILVRKFIVHIWKDSHTGCLTRGPCGRLEKARDGDTSEAEWPGRPSRNWRKPNPVRCCHWNSSSRCKRHNSSS